VVTIGVLAVVFGRGRQRRASAPWARGFLDHEACATDFPVAAVVIWVVVLSLIVAWDLTSFIAQSRELPTLSYFIGRVTRYRAGRAAFFLCWLLIGLGLALGSRRARR
jgi:hypothetical protein